MTRGLAGEYPMNCDSKARVTLPAAHRKILGTSLMLLPFNGRVYGFTPEGFDEWVDSFFERDGKHFDVRNPEDVRLHDGFYQIAVSVEVDSAGRIALGRLDVARPGRRESLGLTGEIIISGNGNHIEVWNAEKYRAANANIDDELVALAFGSR